MAERCVLECRTGGWSCLLNGRGDCITLGADAGLFTWVGGAWATLGSGACAGGSTLGSGAGAGAGVGVGAGVGIGVGAGAGVGVGAGVGAGVGIGVGTGVGVGLGGAVARFNICAICRYAL